MVDDVKIGGLYQHYKGMNYRVLNVARHSETLEMVVVYECLYENELGKIWVRPLGMFLEKISIGGKLVSRFQYMGE